MIFCQGKDRLVCLHVNEMTVSTDTCLVNILYDMNGTRALMRENPSVSLIKNDHGFGSRSSGSVSVSGILFSRIVFLDIQMFCALLNHSCGWHMFIQKIL